MIVKEHHRSGRQFQALQSQIVRVRTTNLLPKKGIASDNQTSALVQVQSLKGICTFCTLHSAREKWCKKCNLHHFALLQEFVLLWGISQGSLRLRCFIQKRFIRWV